MKKVFLYLLILMGLLPFFLIRPVNQVTQAAPPGVPLKSPKTQPKPFDQPAEAVAFFYQKRMPANGGPSYFQRFREALAASLRQPTFSSRLDRALPGSQTRDENDPSWQSLGPGNIGGRTRALVINPTNPDHMVAGGVAGGTWLSLNAGGRWTPTGDQLANLAVCSLAMDPHNPNVILAGTGEGFFNSDSVRGAGIFKSTDGGLNWTHLGATDNADFYYVNDLVYSARENGVAYAATRTGVFRTLDGGATWEGIFSTHTDGGCLDLAIRTDLAADVLFVSVGNRTTATVYRNQDAGGSGTFQAVYSEPDMGRTSIAVAPSNQSVIYLLAANLTGAGADRFQDGLLAVFRSTDGGDSFTARHRAEAPIEGADLLLSNPLAACEGLFLSQGWYDNVVAVDPVDENILWVGGIDTFRSDDGGITWGMASHWALSRDQPNYVHADQHGFFFHPDYNGSDNQTLFITNDGGIFRTDNARAEVAVVDESAACQALGTFEVVFQNLNHQYGVTQFYHGMPYPDGTRYLGGTQDNGTLRGDDAGGANAWAQVFGGDGGYVAMHPDDPDTLYVETTGISIHKSIDGGMSFVRATSGIEDVGMFINPVLMDPNNPERLWTSGRALWRTDNAAVSWQQASTQLDESRGRVSALAAAAGNSDWVIAGTEDGFIRRTTAATIADETTVWQEGQPRAAYVSSVAFDPSNTLLVYATYATFGGPHVFMSRDAGQTWTPIDNNLPDMPVHVIAVHPSDSNRLYLGTDLGVFVSTDQGASWFREHTGYANVVTEWLTFAANDCGLMLFAFTHGRGVWRLLLEGVTLSPLRLDLSANGTAGSFNLTTFANCTWTLSTEADWITLNADLSGRGSTRVDFTVADLAAGEPSRVGVVTLSNAIETKIFTVSQQGCFQSDAFFAALPVWHTNATVLDLVALSGCAVFAKPPVD
ncbi:hypothetical protein [Acanthopleuribacter pedis]|uniref:Glycosyl hydrolase n=1 Tax=Acanthopleuribacter pedis TaxID=442870 RepID=A0A8J7U3G1_9BACT|nr:hypothetical protein [Acanthopleuribacter pedis]MBO1319592.1 hypothetical protein [Acanthopleuribacter pedis]